MAADSRVFMAAVRYATFQKDRIALSRRGARVPRQTCLGDLCERYQPETMFCENLGSDGQGGYTWTCKAELPAFISFSELSVSCEGWNDPDDAFVLDGSCASTYTLTRTSDFDIADDRPKLPSPSDRLQARAFDIVFYSMTFLILYTILRRVIAQHAPRWTPPPIPFLGDDRGGPGGGGGSGGGGGDGRGEGGGGGSGGSTGPSFGGDNDHLGNPSETFNPDLKPTSDDTQAQTARTPQQPGSAGAGFWGGALAVTGLAAVFAAQTGRTPRQQPQQPIQQPNNPTRQLPVHGGVAITDTARTAQPSARLGTGQTAARRRQTYEGFWGVENDDGVDDSHTIGNSFALRTASAFGSGSTR